MGKIRIWLKALRAPFFTASIVPVVVGVVIAWFHGFAFHWNYFLLTLVGVILLHAGANLANDYFDHKNGTDEINVEFVHPFSGGSRMIQEHLLAPGAILKAGIGCLVLGSFIGLWLTFQRGEWILIFGLIGVFSAFFYTAPPIQLVSRGIGEIFIGLNFGVLITLGSYYVQCQALSWDAFWASLPISLLITGVLYINEFPDYTADKAAGKHHMVVRLGKKKAVIGYYVLLILAYILILLGVLLQFLTPFTLLVFLTLPLAIRILRTVQHSYADNLKLASANANTILLHLLVGMLLVTGYVIDKLV
ncbi:1,4-dihydroxy-2-naphthoate octaprenyltransferase [candidate division KSB1 bacterium]|nr:MAG: 1,4-dihydroxy-2-naphthoate octaprenyltransferase [candidate division KSB1 bacterium]